MLLNKDQHFLQPEPLSMAVNQQAERYKKDQLKEHSSSVIDSAPSYNLLVDRSVAEKLFDNRVELKILTAQLGASHIDPDFRSHFFTQIDWLLEIEGWEENDRLPNGESFKTLIKFILNSSPVESPSLGLSDDGNLLAAWLHGANKLLLECMANDHFRYLATSVTDGKKKRSAGDAETLRDLLDLLIPFKTAGWFKRNGENS